MFKKLKTMLGEQPTEDLEQEEMYANSFPAEEIDLHDGNAEEILNSPEANYDLKKQALEMIKNRYLKPQEE